MDDKKRIQELIRQLSDDLLKQEEVISELDRIGMPAVPALIEALSYENTAIRANAIHVLIKIELNNRGNKKIFEAIPSLFAELGREGNQCKVLSISLLHCLCPTNPDDMVFFQGLPLSPLFETLITALNEGDVSTETRIEGILKSICQCCTTIKMLDDLKKDIQENFNSMEKKYQKKERVLAKLQIKIANLMNEIAKRKNELPQYKEILLDDKPKPPKGGRTFQQLRRRIPHG